MQNYNNKYLYFLTENKRKNLFNKQRFSLKFVVLKTH